MSIYSWDPGIILVLLTINIRSIFLGIIKSIFRFEITLYRDGLEYSMTFIIPLLVKELQVLACSLLDLHIHMITELLNHIFGCSLHGFAKTDCQLREGSEDPANYGVTSLAFTGMIIEDAA